MYYISGTLRNLLGCPLVLDIISTKSLVDIWVSSTRLYNPNGGVFSIGALKIKYKISKKEHFN